MGGDIAIFHVLLFSVGEEVQLRMDASHSRTTCVENNQHDEFPVW